MAKITYTKTDEAPALATYSFLPILEAFGRAADVEVDRRDISLAARLLAQFSDHLSKDQPIYDELAYLGELAKRSDANIIKLPNISASVPQLKAAIAELQQKGYAVPDYPENPTTDHEKEIQQRYGKVLGSAVNPVLREGNSDRRVAKAVKDYARSHPHSMGAWSKESLAHVSSMTEGDFFGTEKSLTMDSADEVQIVFESSTGTTEVLKDWFKLKAGEVIDSAVLNADKLKQFLRDCVRDAKSKGVLFSIHLKATMMKVSDPILFGAAVEAYFEPVFKKYPSELKQAGVDSRLGLGDFLKKIEKLPPQTSAAIKADIEACLEDGPGLAMVDVDKKITNLHVPSDVIVDASMPAAIRSSGKMWDRSGKLIDIKAIIPDRSYASVYQETIDFCKQHGAFDPRTMGSVSNVGLMAQKAEEYGSHDKTFWIKNPGRVLLKSKSGQILMEQAVSVGDIFRMCQTKEAAILDWIGLAIKRAQETGQPTIFWLDEKRAHDRELIKKVKGTLESQDLQGADLRIANPKEATRQTLDLVKSGKDTVSVTGNVLRDYLTDLFPILELGTSAKMLSIVPLLAGGGLYETGAGGTAPKHVQQVLEENHLRWDSLGEFLALAVSLEDLGRSSGSSAIAALARALDEANKLYLTENRSPEREAKQLDTRGSHFYLCLYWAEALAKQDNNLELKQHFNPVAKALRDHKQAILDELAAVQGKPADLRGYYFPEEEACQQVMRPSKTFNQIISGI